MSNDHIPLLRLPGGSSTNLDLLRVVQVHILSCLKIIQLTGELTWFQLRSLWKIHFHYPLSVTKKWFRRWDIHINSVSNWFQSFITIWGDVLVNFREFLPIFLSFDGKIANHLGNSENIHLNSEISNLREESTSK